MDEARALSQNHPAAKSLRLCQAGVSSPDSLHLVVVTDSCPHQSRTFLQALHPDVPWPACAGTNVARHSEICKGLCSSGTIQAVGFAMNLKSFDSGICWQSLVPAFKEWGFRTLKKLTLVHFRAFWVLLGGEKLPEGNYALTTRTSQARIHMFGSSGS